MIAKADATTPQAFHGRRILIVLPITRELADDMFRVARGTHKAVKIPTQGMSKDASQPTRWRTVTERMWHLPIPRPTPAPPKESIQLKANASLGQGAYNFCGTGNPPLNITLLQLQKICNKRPWPVPQQPFPDFPVT